MHVFGDAGERRPYLGVGQHALGGGQLRACRPQPRRSPRLREVQALQDVPADELPGVEVLAPPQFVMCLAQVDFPGPHHGARLVPGDARAFAVEIDQHLSRVDPVTGLHGRQGDAAVRLRRHGGGSKRFHDARGGRLAAEIGHAGKGDTNVDGRDQRRIHRVGAPRYVPLGARLGGAIVASPRPTDQACGHDMRVQAPQTQQRESSAKLRDQGYTAARYRFVRPVHTIRDLHTTSGAPWRS